MEKTLAIMTFEKGSLHLIAKHRNSAQLSALAQVTSKELKEIGDKILKVDLDHDGVEDQLRCSYWSRWGAASCNVVSSKFGEFNLSGGCNRLGVLDSSTAGMRVYGCPQSLLGSVVGSHSIIAVLTSLKCISSNSTFFDDGFLKLFLLFHKPLEAFHGVLRIIIDI